MENQAGKSLEHVSETRVCRGIANCCMRTCSPIHIGVRTDMSADGFQFPVSLRIQYVEICGYCAMGDGARRYGSTYPMIMSFPQAYTTITIANVIIVYMDMGPIPLKIRCIAAFPTAPGNPQPLHPYVPLKSRASPPGPSVQPGPRLSGFTVGRVY